MPSGAAIESTLIRTTAIEPAAAAAVQALHLGALHGLLLLAHLVVPLSLMLALHLTHGIRIAVRIDDSPFLAR